MTTKIIGYYGSWNLYQTPSLIPMNTTSANLVTHISYSFMNFNANGNLMLGDPWADIQKPLGTAYGDSSPLQSGYLGGNLHNLFRMKKNSPWIKTGIEIGGYTFSKNISSVLSSSTRMTNFANGVRNYTNNFGVDYIGLDIESVTFNTTLMPNLLARIKNAINVTLFYSLGGGDIVKYTTATIQSMNQYISTWNLMCIDFAGSWSQSNDLISNSLYPDCDNMVTIMLNHGVPANKIVIELQLYARPSGPSVYGDTLTYNSSTLKNFETNNTIYNTTACSQMVYDSNGVLFTYDSVNSVTDKVNYIKNKGLGGISYWMLGNDRYAPQESLLQKTRDLLPNEVLDRKNSSLSFPLSIYRNIKTPSLA